MKPKFTRIAALAISSVILASNAFAQMSAPLHNHSFYSGACCNNKDCEPISDNAVVETNTGFDLEYRSVAGMIVKGFIKRGQEKPSPDGRNHACRMPNGVRCFYRAPPSM